MTTEGHVKPKPCLRLSRPLWTELTCELHRRTEGCHESGAFLMGRKNGIEREVTAVIYYDQLDPAAYSTGVCMLHADAFGRLWNHCAMLGVSVIGDAHVHALGACQSRADKENPMIAQPGHLALIFPLMASPPISRWAVGVYEYLGNHQWRSHSGRRASSILKIED